MSFALPKNAGPSKLRARCCSTPSTPLNAALIDTAVYTLIVRQYIVDVNVD